MSLRGRLEAAKWRLKGEPLAASAAARDDAGLRTPRSLREHLDAILAWLARAHDATERKGVARSFVLRRHHRYKTIKWLPAYPETTGYIVPTLYEAARMLDRPELATRATEMAAWEADLQMASGAVRGGTVADEESPAVFNTGQVLFGWLAAHAETNDARYLESARRAASWLVANQDEDGAWRRGASRFASPGGHVYNARAAWGLGLFGVRANDEPAKQAARRSAEFVLANQLANGWIGDNCLSDPTRPLTHTIAYAAQGVLEIGLLLDEPRFVEAARRVAKGTLGALRADGFLPGRLDREWRPAVDWSCVTGAAQMGLVWDRLDALDRATPNPSPSPSPSPDSASSSWKGAADRATKFVCATQDLDSEEDGIRGGVAGSFPIWGDYGNYEYLNWAAKFAADLLLGRVAGAPGGTRG